ncbi:MAG: serine protein kinase RIO [Candidatus Contendobacter sp.]|nr:serine protein kinase RIO [Gammaproteobacteria bacterium]MCC8993755.1 serine protein kinase RIO [Candidatus Contendobacter sp.]
MKIPRRMKPLVDEGLVDEILGELKSGKEAQVYMVRCGDAIRCAKVYKEAHQRSFKQAVQYQEGRKVRSSRRTRAMAQRTRYGQKEQEAAWLHAEVDALYQLAAAGVRVPAPLGFVEGVLLMELVVDAEGRPAPQLHEVTLTHAQAREYHLLLLAEVVRMLCAGLIHGDLSEFNILVDAQGPVIIDLPQAVNAAANNSAKMMLVRDVANITAYFGRFADELLTTDYGQEIWALYQQGNLSPDIELTGYFERSAVAADVDEVMRVIEDAREEAVARQAAALDALEAA